MMRFPLKGEQEGPRLIERWHLKLTGIFVFWGVPWNEAGKHWRTFPEGRHRESLQGWGKILASCDLSDPRSQKKTLTFPGERSLFTQPIEK